MERYSREELDQALQTLISNIGNCENMQPKFAEGTSQHTLLKNRIKALYISKSLISNEDIKNTFSKEELTEAIRPISSIISKCEKAQLKLTMDTPPHTRLMNIIKAMRISKSLITEEITKRG